MLPSTSSREALLTCPPSSPWNLLSFTVEYTLSSPCSRSDPLLPRQCAVTVYLDSLSPYDLVLWTDGSVLFSFGKGGSGVLANCSFCGTKATLSFSAGPVCSIFSVEACTLLQALCWSRQHQQVCHFSSLLLLSNSRSVLTALSFPPSILLSQSLWQELSSFSSFLSGYNGFPETRFSHGTTRLMSWRDGERYLFPLQSLVVSLLPSLVSTLVFSRIGGVLFHQNSLTHRFPRFPPRNLCSLVMLAVFSLVFAATDTSLHLSSYLSKTGKIENPSYSVCGHSSQDSSHLILQCPAMDFLRRWLFGDSLSLYDLWFRAQESCSASGAPWSSVMPPSLERGWATATTTRKRWLLDNCD